MMQQIERLNPTRELELLSDYAKSQGFDLEDIAQKASRHFQGDAITPLQRDLTEEEVNAFIEWDMRMVKQWPY